MVTTSPFLQRILHSLVTRILAGLVIAYFLFGYFAVNPLAQRLVPWLAEQQLASRASVGHVYFDPLRWQLDIGQLRLTEPDGSPLASFEALHLDLNSNGLWQWAWKLDRITLAQPYIHLHISPQGRLNWGALIAKLNETPSPPSDSLPRVVIEQLAITQGKLDYQDKQHGTTSAVTLTPLTFSLNGFSTLPKDRGDYLLAATLPDQGGTLKWKGSISVNPLTSSGKLSIAQLQLSPLLKLLPPAAQTVQLTQGALNSQFDYTAAITEENPSLTLTQLQLTLDQLQGTHPAFGQFALTQSRLRIPQLHIGMQAGWQADMQGIAFDSQPLQLHNADSTLQLAAMSATLPALSLRAQASLLPEVQDLNISLQGLTLLHQNHALLSLPALNVRQVSLDHNSQQWHIATLELLQGKLSATRLATGLTDWQQALSAFTAAPTSTAVTAAPAQDTTATAAPISIDAIRLQQWQLVYHDHSFKQPLAMRADNLTAGLALRVDGQQSSLQQVSVDIAHIAVTSADLPAATLASIHLKDGQIALQKQQIQAAALTLTGLQSNLIKSADGSINWQQILAPASAPATTKLQVAAARPDKTPPGGWSLRLQTLALQQSALHIEDRSTPQAVVLDARQLQAEIKNASLDLKQALPVKASFDLQQGGRFELSGTLTPAPLKASIQLSLREAALKPFSPLLNQQATLLLENGDLSLSGKLTVTAPEAVRFEGGFNLRQLSIVEDTVQRSPFLQWVSLSSDSVSLSTAPRQLSIATLTLSKPQGKFIIHPDRSLNVTQVLRQPATAAPAGSATTPAANSAATDAGFAVNIEALRIDQANLTFADLSLTPQFGTVIHHLSGVINSLSTHPGTVAQVELDGKVDDYGAARIRGSVQPLQATQFTNLKLAFTNLEMNRLTPYSGKFAGRKIESGKLSVDLLYNVKQRQLAGENKFVIQKLKLGDKVDSKEAADLPLDLAIAILEDSDGIIDLDLPISGSLDDPQFSYGSIVWKAFKNILSKIVTAPFRALGNLFGGGDKLEALAFEPGKADLSPPEQEKLQAVSTALGKRQQLALGITPGYAVAADTRALQEAALRRQVAEALGSRLDHDQAAGPIDLNNPKVQAVIRTLHDRLTNKGLLKRLAGKLETPNADYFAAAQEALTVSIVISDATLEALGNARGASVQNALLATGIASERVSIKPALAVKSDGKMVPAKLTLDVMKP